MASRAALTGHCLCGAVSIRVQGDHDPAIGACHCRMCQIWSGGLFLCFDAPAASVEIKGPVTRYPSSSFSERAFCTRCGSHLWMRDTGQDDAIYNLMPGLFDAAARFPLRSEIYTDRALDSIRLSGDHPRATRAEYEAQAAHVKGDTP